MSYQYASYCRNRDERASLNEEATDRILCEHFGISKEELVVHSGDIDDFRGADRTLPCGSTIQKKNVECYAPAPHLSNTVTVPCKNYHQEYNDNDIDWLLHSYYNKSDPTGVRQYVLVKFSVLKELFDERRKRRNAKTGTDFYFWPYSPDYRLKSNEGDPINLLERCECYKLP